MPATAAPTAAPSKTSTTTPTPSSGAAPSTAPAGGGSGSVQPPPEKAPEDFMADEGRELESLDGDYTGQRTPAKPAEPETPAETTQEFPGEEPETPAEPEKPAGGKKEKPTYDPNSEKEPSRVDHLREGYRVEKKTRQELQGKVAKLESTLKELQSAKPEDLTVLQKQLEETTKRNQQLESEMAFVDYTKSTEYQKKYHEPYVDAWKKALADVTEFSVELEDGTTRPATEKDLLALCNLPTGEAFKMAKQMFGELAGEMMGHRRKIKELYTAQEDALENARKTASERSQKTELQQKAFQQEREKLWQQANAHYPTKYPLWYDPSKITDPAEKDMLVKAYAKVDKLFMPSEENPRPSTPQESVKLHAEIRNKFAIHDLLVSRLKAARAEITELRKSLEEFENSTPNGGLGRQPSGGGGEGDPGADADAEIDRLDKLGR